VTTPQYDPRTQPLAPSPTAEAGEAQREYVVQRLSDAFAADRISVDELDARLGMVYRATSLQQLGQLLEDPSNPGWSLEKPLPGARVAQEFAVPDRGVGFAFMGGFERGKGWVLPRHFKAMAVMGGVELDLRDARFAPGVSEIEVFAFWGGIEIIVPDGVRVESVGMAVMGGISVTSGETSLDDPDAPVLRISGLALMGGVEVSRKDRNRGREKRYRQALKRAEAAKGAGRRTRG